jgi:hypothetical protein
LGVDLANQQLKEKERQNATSGLEGLYGVNTNEALGGLGEVASNVNANTQAENASWDWAKDILDPIMASSGQAASGFFGGKR